MTCASLPDLFDRSLAAAEAERMAVHVETCAACRAELATWRSVEDAIVRSDDVGFRPTPLQAQRLVALGRQRLERRRRPIWMGWPALGAAMVGAAAAVVAIAFFTQAPESPSDSMPPVAVAPGPSEVRDRTPSSVPPEVSVTPEPIEVEPLELRVLLGHVASTEARGATLEAPRTERLVVTLGDDRVGLAKRARAEVVEAVPGHTRIRVLRGTTVFQVSKRDPGEKFEVEAGDYLVTVVGTVFAVSVYPPDNGIAVDVEEGTVKVEGDDDVELETTFVTAGQRLRLGERVRKAGVRKAVESVKILPLDRRSENELQRVIALAEDAAAKNRHSQKKAADPRFATWRGWIRSGNTEMVEIGAKEHLALRPKDVEAWWILAEARRVGGSWALAVDAYRTVIRLSRNGRANAARLKCAAVLQDHLDEHDAAVELLEAYLVQKSSVRPKEAKAMIRLAKSWHQLGKTGQAEELLRQLMIKFQGRPWNLIIS